MIITKKIERKYVERKKVVLASRIHEHETSFAKVSLKKMPTSKKTSEKQNLLQLSHHQKREKMYTYKF